MKERFFFVFVCIYFGFTFSPDAQVQTFERQIDWTESITELRPGLESTISIPHFKNAAYSSEYPGLPLFSERIPLSSFSKIRVEISNIKTEFIDLTHVPDRDIIQETPDVVSTIDHDRNIVTGRYYFIPIVKRGNIFEKITAFTVTISVNPVAMRSVRGPSFKLQSNLRDGQIYKISVDKSGIHALDYTFLKNVAGIDIDQISSTQINILGNGGGNLPQLVSADRIDDVEPIPLYIEGGDDNKINPGDRIIFYAEGPDLWNFDPGASIFRYQKNPYDDFNTYYIKISSDPPVRIQERDLIATTEYQSAESDVYLRFEEDRVNLLGKFRKPGSGKLWFGDEFSGTREREYNDLFTIPDYIPFQDMHLEVSFAARSGVTSQYQVEINGQTFSRNISKVKLGNPEDDFARIGIISASIPAQSETQQIKITYPQVSGSSSSGWLDYIQLNARRFIYYTGEMTDFRDIVSANFETAELTIKAVPDNLRIWDITTPHNPVEQRYQLQGSEGKFGYVTQGEIREFIAFQSNGDLPGPQFVAEVPNQDLHSIQQADYLIIYHPEFSSAAERLAQHRRDFDGLNVVNVDVDQVMNEFGGGSLDPTAIRDMAKMLYSRDPDFRFLLLIGDGSYDFRYRDTEQDNDNFVPTYESDESLDPIRSFPSDDYYALLTDSEGNNLKGALDIAIGRLPVGSALEADQVVNKIIHYELDPQTLGDWRLRSGFVADDEDTNLHLNQSDRITTKVDTAYPFLNLEKIYFDAFQQTSTPGGERYPGANAAINTLMFKGCLVMNYLGHGGHNGWAQERCLGVPDILSWKNRDKLPIYVTATCSFTGYDEPSYISAGEHVLLNPEGGAVALFTTVRAVYSTSNERLTKEVFNNIYEFDGNSPMRIGEIMRISKNTNAPDTLDINARKFALIGDPAMKLALPVHKVVVTALNDQAIEPGNPDTISALQKITVAGQVQDRAGNFLSQFNGKVQITVFDKNQVVRTLGNDSESPPRNFKVRNKVLFKGTATVSSGEFQFTFVVPKDINFSYGTGKMSFYASDGISTDAAGYFTDFVIGGNEAGNLTDNDGPLIDIFLNDENFVFGGSANPNPILFLKLSDDSGINVIGSSIGHDLEGVLDDQTSNSFVLNDFYEAKLDDYRSGEVRYPLFNLEPGKHSIKVTAWDIANNFSDAYTEFIVVDDASLTLDHVLNYPNPFTTSTCFQFEHNLPGVPMDILVQIFTVSGRLVKTIEHFDIISDGFRVTDIKWDGRDDYGDDLGRGVYLYKVKVITPTEEGKQHKTESDFEKLVLLK